MTIKTGKERTLLLVDDEDNIRRALTRLLRRDGYTILQAESGAQALDMLEAQPSTGVILSDQRMPNMTGIEFLSRARELRPDTVRIVLSGYTDLKTVTEAINQGEIYKFLTKPWEDDLLRTHITEAFDHYELRFEKNRLAQELQQINAELEKRVEQKTREALMSVHALQISQEVLEHLPVVVLGIDMDGLVVVANRQAGAQLDCPRDNCSLIGQYASDVLPLPVFELVESVFKGGIPAPINIKLGTRTLHVHCGRMNQTIDSEGVIVVMLEHDKA